MFRKTTQEPSPPPLFFFPPRRQLWSDRPWVYSSAVEHRIADPAVAGSIPAAPFPSNFFSRRLCFVEARTGQKRQFVQVPVAQLDKASDYESEDWGFESLQGYYFYPFLALKKFIYANTAQ